MDTKDKIIVLLDCFALSEAKAALKTFGEVGGEAERVVFAPITDVSASMRTEDVVNAVASGGWQGGKARAGGKKSALIAGADKKNAVALVRCFKNVLPRDSDSAFAMVTGTGMNWPVQYYLEHIRKEHNYMKTADPESDPDMRAIEDID